MIKIRNLRTGEALPVISPSDGLPIGFEGLPLDHEWVWLAEHHGQCVGILIAAPAHSILLIFRITLTSTAPAAAALLLLRRAFRDARARGCAGWMSVLADQSPAEVRLMRIAMRVQATCIPMSGMWAGGTFNIRGV